MPATAYVIIGVLVGFALGLLIALWRKRPDLAQPLEQTERRLVESFSKANADMAARVESVKGELRTNLGEQVQHGLGNIRDLLDRQLAEGREEQARRLRDAAAGLETKFAALQAATETRLTQFAEAQGIALRDSVWN
jgi:gas vesicle protein